MKSMTTTADIYLDDQVGIQYKVAVMQYIEYEDESYEYLLYPNYSVIDMLKPPMYQGIPGYDLSKRKEVYIRKNRTPVLISERAPSKNRVDLQDLLASCHMTYLNKLLWLIRTQSQYFGDYFYFLEHKDNDTIHIGDMKDLGNRSAYILHELLKNICIGNTIICNGITIDDTNRLGYYTLLFPIYITEKKYIDSQRIKGVLNAKAEGKYKGRKRKEIDYSKLYELCHAYENSQISIQEITKILDISESTFFRRYREYRKKQL